MKAIGKSDWYLDADRDGYGAGTATSACLAPSTEEDLYVLDSSDCDDQDADVNQVPKSLPAMTGILMSGCVDFVLHRCRP